MEAPEITVTRARELRRKMTLPEVLLWQAIRGRKIGGRRFRRQHPIGPFILDFFCDELDLAVEVDGEGHADADKARLDRERTEWLAARRIVVLRIPARDVLANIEAVVDMLGDRVRGWPPPPLRGPPPPTGED